MVFKPDGLTIVVANWRSEAGGGQKGSSVRELNRIENRDEGSMCDRLFRRDQKTGPGFEAAP